jgi:hypothetical protein
MDEVTILWLPVTLDTFNTDTIYKRQWTPLGLLGGSKSLVKPRVLFMGGVGWQLAFLSSLTAAISTTF